MSASPVCAIAAKSELAPRTKSHAHDLCDVLDDHPAVRVLSLDCFDTLLWRNTAAPVDVFYDLANHPAFAKLGLNAKIRVKAELAARERKIARCGLPEVTLAEIYRAAFPDLDDAAVRELAAAEVDAEIAACVPLPATVALLRRAKEKGLRVVIVSDTYLVEEELRRLLAATLPADAYAAIDRVFCSSAFGRSKSGGLFKPVLDLLGLRARDVLHVGDNPSADVHPARAIGMNAVHLLHHEAETESLLRMQTTAASLLMPSVRETAGMPSPFRALIAASPVAATPGPEFLLGYASLGPILYSFGRWLLDDLEAMRREGKSVKPVFLLRDGYMPARVARILAGDEVGPFASVSRFAATAASFRTADDIERYVADWAGSGRFADLGHQLLLTDAEASALVAKTRKADRPQEIFLREMLRPKMVSLVTSRSTSYRARLFEHLRRTAGIEAGDTLVLIDLGYEGTAQRRLEPLLRDELDVEVVGRYLLAARVPGWETSRRGLLDPSWCDDRLLSTVVAYVGLLENLCAADLGSTVDYTADGEPILAASIVDPNQTARVEPVQAACEQFVRDAMAAFSGEDAPPLAQLRVVALASLARLLLLPTKTEVGYLAGFALDMNLGSDDLVPLFDFDRGIEGLRRHGLFSITMDSERTARIAGPVELRAASLELALTTVAQHRFGLEMARPDMTHRREPLGVLALRREGAARAVVEAQATYDGWFAAHVPIGEGDSAIGFMFGERYGWVQVESVTRIELSALLRSAEAERSEDVSAFVHPEGLAARGGGLYECTAKEGFLLLALPPAKARGPHVCRVVFRPISARREP